MNQEPNNNIENTQTNLENTQTVLETTQTQPVIENTQVQPTIENTQAQPVIENTQTVEMAPVSDVTEELDLPTTSSENTETLQPAIAPTVSTSAPIQEEKVEIVEDNSNVEVGTTPHDVPIPDENSKKDFVIKSKKETVAEDTKLREAKIAEHVKKANENYKPNSKFKNVLLIIFLVFIIAFTYFLPEIHNLITRWQSGELEPKEEVVITTGVLSCSYEKSSENLDYTYIADFKFKDNKLESYSFSTETKGSESLDKDKLDTLKENCRTMSKESDNIDGITVSCVSETNLIKVVEAIELKEFKEDSITTAYTEAGGTYPKFNYHDDMDTLEKNMKADGYTCERIAS